MPSCLAENAHGLLWCALNHPMPHIQDVALASRSQHDPVSGLHYFLRGREGEQGDLPSSESSLTMRSRTRASRLENPTHIFVRKNLCSPEPLKTSHLLWPKQHHGVQVALHTHALAQRFPSDPNVGGPVKPYHISSCVTHAL